MTFNHLQFINEDKTFLIFHKSCVDGFFSVLIFLQGINQATDTLNDNYILYPLSPSDIIENKPKVQVVQNKKKVILDLAIFGSNVLYFFDHHVSNKSQVQIHQEKKKIKGFFDTSAASTSSILLKYFKIDNQPLYIHLSRIADIVDQAKFQSSPPLKTQMTFTTDEDVVWGCNDLIKQVKNQEEIFELFYTFEIDNLQKWLCKHKKKIIEYRKKREKTINILERIEYSPILFIVNHKYYLQMESLHFMYSTTKSDYIMMIVVEKLYKGKKKTHNKHTEYRISFRLNPNLLEEQTKKYRVDKIAKQLGGGGHKGAASVKIKNFNSAYLKIVKWLDNFSIGYIEQSLK